MRSRIVLSVFCLAARALAEPLFPPSPAEMARTRCARALEAQLASLPEVAPPPRAVGEAHRETAARPVADDRRTALSGLIARLATLPSDLAEFRRQFDSLEHFDPLFREAQRYLRRAGVPVEVRTLPDPTCRVGKASFSSVPVPKVTVCAVGGLTLQELRTSFIHEAIHAMQNNQDSPAAFFRHGLPNGQVPSTAALRYTMGAPFADSLREVEQHASRQYQAIAPANRPRLEELDEAMAFLERYYYFDRRDGHLVLRPKTIAGQTAEQWQQELTRALTRRLDPGEDPLDIAMLPSFVRAWARAHPAADFPSLPARLEGLQRAVDARYAALAELPQGAAMREILDENYLRYGRVLTHLTTYCLEMQTQFFNALEDVNFARGLQPFPACGETINSLLMAGARGTERFSLQATPAELDAHLERHTRQLISHSPYSYGGAFDALHGYEGHPEIFNAENCRRYRHDFRDEIPARE